MEEQDANASGAPLAGTSAGGGMETGFEGAPDEGAIPFAGDPLVGQEKILERELVKITSQLEELKTRCHQLRQANDDLQNESQKIRVESHEYMCYIDKKTKRRESMIVSHNDKKLNDLEDIKTTKEAMVADFELKEEELRKKMIESERELSDIRSELDEVAHYKVLRREQEEKIRQLENELQRTKEQEVACQQDMKRKYARSRKQYEDAAREKVESMKMAATKDAEMEIRLKTEQLRRQNSDLRNSLNTMVTECKVLAKRKDALQAKRSHLQAEIKAQQHINYYRYGSPITSATHSGRHSVGNTTCKERRTTVASSLRSSTDTTPGGRGATGSARSRIDFASFIPDQTHYDAFGKPVRTGSDSRRGSRAPNDLKK